MDVVKHECHEHSDDDGDQRCRDIGLIEKQDDGEDKKYDRHQSACESVESVGDIDGIDDRDSDEECQYRIKDSERDFACDRPKIDIIDA